MPRSKSIDELCEEALKELEDLRERLERIACWVNVIREHLDSGKLVLTEKVLESVKKKET